MTLKLFGSTVKNFRCSLGFETQTSSVDVSVVEDEDLGDYFLPPPVGSPAYITFGSLNFWGLLQKWVASASPDGLPAYDIRIEDPRAILEGTELILGGYSGTTAGVPNLLNCYGYWENLLGFGGSQVNESGMPWSLIATAITNMTSSSTSYGGPLSFKGYNYNVDLSGLPTPPSYYRLGGNNINLLNAISQICQDAACDFFIDLIPETTTIRVNTISRRNQPPTGYIASLVNSVTASGICKRSSVGLESRNESSSAFMVGAEQTAVYEAPVNAILTYFGKSILGQPIIGTIVEPGNPYSLTANLNAAEIADIIGSSYYTCNALEMCCAMSDFSMWLAYIQTNKPTLATLLGTNTPFLSPLSNGILVPQTPEDAQNFTATNVSAAVEANYAEISRFVTQRVFNLVLKNANEYLGKRFLVQMPFIFTKIEPETGRLIFAAEPTNNAWKDGAPPLGLNTIYAESFRSQDDKYEAYAGYVSNPGMDYSRIKNDDVVVDLSGVYTRVSVGENIIFLNPVTPAVEITVANPMYAAPIDATGAGSILAEAALNGTIDSTIIEYLNRMFGGGPIPSDVSPLPFQPSGVAIPLKSNILKYGPWYVVGAAGKVTFIEDNSLAPWNYGGVDNMGLAANARISESLTYQQEAETGEFEIVEEPRFNLGQRIVALGPTITGIDINYGESGITSTYRIQTFSTKFGLFSRSNIERIKRLTLANQQLKKNLKQAFINQLLPNGARNENIAFQASAAMNSWPRQYGKSSPANYLVGYAVKDNRDGILDRAAVGIVTSYEMPRCLRTAIADEYRRTVVMSIDGLIRPINTDTTVFEGESIGTDPYYLAKYLASYEEPNSEYDAGITADFYNPFKTGNDVQVYNNSSATYADCHAYLNDGPADQKAFALRAPLVLSGWGWCTDDAAVPNESPTDLTGGFLADYLRRSTFWKTGPVDLLWDDERKMWTPHGFMLGKTKDEDIDKDGGSGEVDLYSDAETKLEGRKKERTVYNFFSKKVPKNTKIMAAWVPEANSWWIVAADCT
jgi:hypothetical protein